MIYNLDILNKEDNTLDNWRSQVKMSASYTCGYCGLRVNSEKGLNIDDSTRWEHYLDNNYGVYICTNCKLPTFIYGDIQVPGNEFGNSVSNVPEEVNNVYEEARKSFSVGAYSGVILLARKLIMHVAVSFKAEEGKTFAYYVQYLSDNNYISVRSNGWIDEIRKMGNQSNHEIEINTKDDAEKIIKFCEMLLKTNYEYPAMIDDASIN